MRTLVAVCASVLLACGSTASPSPAPLRTATPPAATARTAAAACTATPNIAATKATIELEKGGSIQVALRPDKAPNTVRNFAGLARAGCYDGLTFHRVEPNFVVQGGDPLGTGTGGGNQPTELSDLPFTKGALGIARGNNIQISNSHQFFICTGNCRHLDGQYTNFGQVTAGQEIADAVRRGDKIKTIRVE